MGCVEVRQSSGRCRNSMRSSQVGLKTAEEGVLVPVCIRFQGKKSANGQILDCRAQYTIVPTPYLYAYVSWSSGNFFAGQCSTCQCCDVRYSIYKTGVD